jgi:hypothetical protein
MWKVVSYLYFPRQSRVPLLQNSNVIEARKLIRAGNVDILSLVQPDSNSTSVNLPTSLEPKSAEESPTPGWVPDWRKEIRVPCGQISFETSFNISKTDPQQSSPNEPAHSGSDDDVLLRLEGYIIDEIQHLSTITWQTGTKVEATPELPQYLSTISVLCQLSNFKHQFRPDPYPNPSDRATAHFRVPVADMFDSNIFTTHCGISQEFGDIKKGYEDVLAYLNNPELDKRAVQSSLEDMFRNDSYYSMLEQQTFRKPMLLRDGLVGLAPAIAKVGDVVVIFKGAKFPYVLRRQKVRKGKTTAENESGDEELWELVGEAYVHGVMYGELFDEEGKTELVKREFVLV